MQICPSQGLRRSSRSSFLLAALFFVLSLSAVGTLYAIDLDHPITVDIRAGDRLDQVLMELIGQTETPLSFATASVAGYRTPELKGTYSLAVALNTLLKDTGLIYYTQEGLIYIKRPGGITSGPRKHTYPSKRNSRPGQPGGSESADSRMAEVV